MKNIVFISALIMIHNLTLTSQTIRTPLGNIVKFDLATTEWTAAEKAAIKRQMAAEYPNAVFLSDATHFYNCHSFAWYQQSPANQFWINVPDIYWNDCSYIRQSAWSGEKIYYDDGKPQSGFHSAITYDANKQTVISKWGKWPLVLHKYNDSPYSGYSLKFYKKYTEAACVMAENLRIPTITEKQLVIKWDNWCSPKGWVVEIKKATDPTWFLLRNSDAAFNQLTVNLSSPLATLTKYQIRVTAKSYIQNCSSMVLNFTTPSAYTASFQGSAAGKSLNSDARGEIVEIDLANEASINVYPNPIKEGLYIKLYASKGEEVDFYIFDIFGRAVTSIKKEIYKGNNEIVVENQLPNGQYLLSCTIDGQLISQKIFVARN